MNERVFLSLIELQFHTDDLTFIAAELHQLSFILKDRARQAYEMGRYNEYLFVRAEAHRCADIANKIYLSGRTKADEATK